MSAETAELVPNWLNDEFFKTVLKQKIENETNNVVIINKEISLASAKNENYCSVLYRALVEYRHENVVKKQAMVIKVAIEEEGEQKELFKESTIFETEIAMYSIVVPKFEAMLRAINDDTKLAPNMLYYNLSPRKVIVFEDLVANGYEVIKDRALNFEETKAVYTKIAKWHALSFKILKECPDFFKDFYKNNFPATLKDNPAFSDGILNFIALLESQTDLLQYKTYFEPFIGHLSDSWSRAVNEFTENFQPTSFYVLCHGDFHHKNMMFKRNIADNTIDNLLLLDFQQCYIGPIVNDVLNSIYMIMDGEQRLKNLQKLLDFYFETFQNTLKRFNFDETLPTMFEFNKQMMRHKNFELFLFTSAAPMLMAVDAGIYDIGELMTDAEKRKAIYKNPVYIEQVRQLLPKYVHEGYLKEV